MYKNHDEAMRAEADQELQDKYEAVLNPGEGNMQTSMSVREYALLRGLQPQRVYYYIRNKKIEVKPCGECGRKVIDVESADAIFLPKAEEELGGE